MPVKYLLVVTGSWLIHACLAVALAAGHEHHASAKQPACNVPAADSVRCASAPGVAFSPDGRLWLAWVHKNQVYLSFSSDKGKTLSEPVIVNQQAEKIYAKGENRPKIAFGQNGEIYISWTQKLSKRFSGHIRFSRSIDGGKTFSQPVTVNDHLVETSHRFDVLGVNNKGHIYIAWLDKRDLLAAKAAGKTYNGAALYYAFSTDNGVTFSRNRKIADHTCQCCRVAMAFDKDQLPVIIWRHIYGSNIRDHGLVKFIAQDLPGIPRRLSYDNWQVDACPHHGPAISIAADNVYHTVWFNNATDRHGLFYAHSKDQGETFSQPVNFGNYQQSASHADVLSSAKRVFFTWKEFDGKSSHLFLMYSMDSGKSWSAPQKLATSSAITDHPFLLSDKNKIYVSWHRKGELFRLIAVSEQ